jgi:hypothetical protein
MDFLTFVVVAPVILDVVVVVDAVVVLLLLFFFSCKKFMEPYWQFELFKVIFSEVCFNRA